MRLGLGTYASRLCSKPNICRVRLRSQISESNGESSVTRFRPRSAARSSASAAGSAQPQEPQEPQEPEEPEEPLEPEEPREPEEPAGSGPAIVTGIRPA